MATTWSLKRMIWHVRRNYQVIPIRRKIDRELLDFEEYTRENFSLLADELDALKDYICKQQVELNELRKLIERT